MNTRTPLEFYPHIRPARDIVACDGEPFTLPAGTSVIEGKRHNGRLLVVTAGEPRGWRWVDPADVLTTER